MEKAPVSASAGIAGQGAPISVVFAVSAASRSRLLKPADRLFSATCKPKYWVSPPRPHTRCCDCGGMENYAMRKQKSKDFLTPENGPTIKLLAAVVYVTREIAEPLARWPEPCLYGA